MTPSRPDRQPRDDRAWRRALPRVGVVLAIVAGIVVAAFGPLHVVLGIGRMSAWVLAAAGAWLVIGRTGAVDLSVGVALGAGAVAAVLLSDAGVGAWLVLPVAPAAGAVVGAASGAMTGRLGRRFAALATLTLGLGLLAVGAALLPGGVAGFHAVPLLMSDRPDTVTAVLAAGLGLFAARRLGATVTAARAAVAARRPEVLEAMGPHPVAVSAIVGAWAGALLGLAGGLQAILSGSVVPAAFGLQTTAGLALAAVLGGAAPLGPLLGAAAVWGPGITFPLVPGVGTSPPLLVAGAVGLLLLAARRGRPLVTADATVPARPDDPDPRVADAAHLVVREQAGAAFEVRGGEVVAIIGPNGIGKSTLLARIGGQLPDHGAVDLDGAPLPEGARQRAALGITRTWQRPPDVPGDDLMRAAGVAPRPIPAELAQLEVLARRPPRVALLDEPTTDPESVARLVRGLAEAGAAVVLVDHRDPVQGLADRVIHLGAPRRAASGDADVPALPLGAGSGGRRQEDRRQVVVSDAAVADDVSVFDHLAAVVGPRRAGEFLAAAPLLANRGDDPAGVLSGGERRVLALLTAFAQRPAILVLEGADQGLDPMSTAWARQALRAVQETGATVVVRSSRGDDVQWADFPPD